MIFCFLLNFIRNCYLGMYLWVFFVNISLGMWIMEVCFMGI